jgi:hypothetical protein
MLNRDWPGWHIIAIVSVAIIGASAMITPEKLGISQITVNWVILLMSIGGTIAAAMGNSGLPGQKEVTAMTVGKAVITPTVETKAAAIEAVNAIPVPPPEPK